MFKTEPGGFFKGMVHRDKEEFYKGIQKEAEDKGDDPFLRLPLQRDKLQHIPALER